MKPFCRSAVELALSLRLGQCLRLWADVIVLAKSQLTLPAVPSNCPTNCPIIIYLFCARRRPPRQSATSGKMPRALAVLARFQ